MKNDFFSNFISEEDFIFIRLAQSAVLASILEVMAIKPGNVSPIRSNKNITVNHFLISSNSLFPTYLEAITRVKDCIIKNKPFLTLKIGELIKNAVKETKVWGIDSNTNLGIILLTIPLLIARAFQLTEKKEKNLDKKDLEGKLLRIIKETSYFDSIETIAAIKLANPGGLGKVSKFDVNNLSIKDELKITNSNLYDIFLEASERDLIAKEYVTGFKITLTDLLPNFELFLKKNCLENSITLLSLYLLSSRIDSLILRKYGLKKAQWVKNEAYKRFNTMLKMKKMQFNEVIEFDALLREKGMNPGTHADLITATLFLYFSKNVICPDFSLLLCNPDYKDLIGI